MSLAPWNGRFGAPNSAKRAAHPAIPSKKQKTGTPKTKFLISASVGFMTWGATVHAETFSVDCSWNSTVCNNTTARNAGIKDFSGGPGASGSVYNSGAITSNYQGSTGNYGIVNARFVTSDYNWVKYWTTGNSLIRNVGAIQVNTASGAGLAALAGMPPGWLYGTTVTQWLAYPVKGVRLQGFSDNWVPDLEESLAHRI